MSHMGAPRRADAPRLFWVTSLAGLGVFGLAVALDAVLPVSLLDFAPPTFAGALKSLLIGAAATAPLVALLIIFMRTSYPPLVRFKEAQIDFLGDLGFSLTPFRIVTIGLVAGLGEEALFRGVLQSYAATLMPVAAAIVAPNILFGLLHARTALYAVIAASLGVYLGALFVWTGDLIAPISTHALYDMAALEIARREIAKRIAG
ncbi:MAG: CPBP family intramembrane glutamic endopeptidase [Pseudomonadota bacterium]